MKKVAFTTILLLSFVSIMVFVSLGCGFGHSSLDRIQVKGAVKTPLALSLKDLKALPPFHINGLALLKERKELTDSEELICVADYRGVLLRDVLEKAGMKFKRKWEPGVLFRVRGARNEEVVFSFGEVFYSGIGRSILIAYEKNGKSIRPVQGCAELLVSTDIRSGRRIAGITEICAERVEIELKVYEEMKQGIVRPPTPLLSLIDKKSGKGSTVALGDLQALAPVQVHDKVLIGDCAGFVGVFTFEGVPLRALLEKNNCAIFPLDYRRYVVVSSENGFAATYSFGELFNSRLGNNIVVAYQKDGQLLGPAEGFATMIAEEDNTGGRSVRRISKIVVE